jgi:hypothetical protein
MNNIIWLILDSCRYDNFIRAKTPHFDRIGDTQKRYAYASWTAPSHYVFLMGLLPHQAPRGILAAHVYREEYQRWQQRIGKDAGIDPDHLLPSMNIVNFLNKTGYRTMARVSLPVLNPETALSRYFYDYRLLDTHNGFREIIGEINFLPDQPTFYFLNIGETHYPYMLDDPGLPHISGVHGVLKDIREVEKEREAGSSPENASLFATAQLQTLKAQQVKAVEYCDELFAELIKKCPPETYVIITSDHGELFGEDGCFGHGPVVHRKVFEVPLIEGPLDHQIS